MRSHALLTCAVAIVTLPVRSASTQTSNSPPAQLRQEAQAAYDAKNYSRSAALLGQAIAAEPQDDRAGDEYNAACSYALAGDHAKALHLLTDAVDDGYLDADRIGQDSDFTSLHRDPAFAAIQTHAREIVARDKRHWSMKALATPEDAELTADEKMIGLAQLWAEVRYGFANGWHVPDLDWDQAYRDAIPRVEATRTTFDYVRELQRLIAQLHDGHSNVYFPESFYKTWRRPPLTTRLVDGHVLVTAVADPALIARGIVPGVEVLTIDGSPVRQYAAEHVEPFESASTPQDLAVRTYTYSLLRGKVGQSVRLGLMDARGRQWTEIIARQPAPAAAAPETEISIKPLPGGVVYINLRGFDQNAVAVEFERRFPEVQAAKALVLDVRENGGGDSSIAGRILATLLDQPALTSREALTTYVATYRAWGRVQQPRIIEADRLAPNPKLHFSGKVAVLEGSQTYSAAEDFLVAYLNSGRGILVGEPSGGSTGQPVSFTLPGGVSARVCTKHDSFPDGREFVGVGVQPTLAVHNTVADIRAGHDAVLDRAIAEVTK